MSFFALAALITVSVLVWAGGILIERLQKARKEIGGRVVAMSAVGACILVLIMFKYGRGSLFGMIMPIGLSFYLFQAIGYLSDIAKGKCHAERNFIHLGCLFAFFLN